MQVDKYYHMYSDNGDVKFEEIPNILKMQNLVNQNFSDWEQDEAKALAMGDRIKDLLKIRGMSQRDLATAIHATEVTVSRYVQNQRVPKVNVAIKIAHALDVPLDVLVGINTQMLNVVYCKDCVKHNCGIEYAYEKNLNWEGNICPLIKYRGKAEGHEFDYQYCAYGKRKEEKQ